MTLGRKPPSRSRRPQNRGGSPAWLMFLVAVALVFGVYYLWLGVRNFVSNTTEIIRTATQEAVVVQSTTRQSAPVDALAESSFATSTPLPECMDFIVIAQPSAVLRAAPTTDSAPVDTIRTGQTICVLHREGDTNWYLVDTNPRTRRIESAYVRDDLVEAANPTPTPTNTFTPAPTVTPMPPTATLPPTATPTLDPDITLTPTASATPSPSPTMAARSA